MNSSSAQAGARRQLSALVSAGTTVLGILVLVWMATQIGEHRRPPTGTEAAEVLDISPSTADRHWAYARAWLQAEVRGC